MGVEINSFDNCVKINIGNVAEVVRERIVKNVKRLLSFFVSVFFFV